MIVPSKNQDIKRSNRKIFAREMVMMMSLLHACSSPPPPSIDRLGLSSKTSSYAHLYVIMLDTFIIRICILWLQIKCVNGHNAAAVQHYVIDAQCKLSFFFHVLRLLFNHTPATEIIIIIAQLMITCKDGKLHRIKCSPLNIVLVCCGQVRWTCWSI